MKSSRFIACSGFPVPVSRYWGEFPAVEIAETAIGMPGAGTVRRWLREAPEGFAFTLMAPQQFSVSGFAVDSGVEKLLDEMASLAKKIKAKAVVFVASEEFTPSRTTRAAIRDFAEALPKTLPNPVLDLPAWDPEDVRTVTKGLPVIVAYDPLSDFKHEGDALDYMRLLGPAGHRSRYEESALVRVAERFVVSKAKTTFCVFRNIDMYANGKKLLQLVTK